VRPELDEHGESGAGDLFAEAGVGQITNSAGHIGLLRTMGRNVRSVPWSARFFDTESTEAGRLANRDADR
jgi:hypothetical protein